MTRPARFSQADVTRALRAVERAGLPIAGIEISAQTGNIRVLTGEPEAADNANWFSGSPLYRDGA